jgi:hypothetical protein
MHAGDLYSNKQNVWHPSPTTNKTISNVTTKERISATIGSGIV